MALFKRDESVPNQAPAARPAPPPAAPRPLSPRGVVPLQAENLCSTRALAAMTPISVPIEGKPEYVDN